ncbi:MAG: methylmalonyl Co-A mutase-associated GTPase MeaB [Desulfurococcales archaeon]|nr:methylmalonyl Co-A mutase-associated GTPase MeaB [Desulfurococcales archaeon]
MSKPSSYLNEISDDREVLAKDKRKLSKLITKLESDPDSISDVLDSIWVLEPKAHVVGVTGSAGVGKSTLIAGLAKAVSGRNYRVAILAIDPSSPLSGGAVLGDRVRMDGLTSENVFVRSMSTSTEEALPWKALLVIELLEGAGYDYIIVETPGAGQYSVNIMRAVDTVIVTLMPGAGDEIQAIKAGLMEIGDIYVVNKADKPEAEVTYNQVLFAVRDLNRNGWKPEVVKVSALYSTGMAELVSTLYRRNAFIRKSGLQTIKRRERRKLELELLLNLRLKEVIKEVLESGRNSELRLLYEEALAGKLSTVSAAKKITSKLAELLKIL